MLVWAIIASGIVSAFLWKKANPGKKLTDPLQERLASSDLPRSSSKP